MLIRPPIQRPPRIRRRRIGPVPFTSRMLKQILQNRASAPQGGPADLLDVGGPATEMAMPQLPWGYDGSPLPPRDFPKPVGPGELPDISSDPDLIVEPIDRWRGGNRTPRQIGPPNLKLVRDALLGQQLESAKMFQMIRPQRRSNPQARRISAITEALPIQMELASRFRNKLRGRTGY